MTASNIGIPESGIPVAGTPIAPQTWPAITKAQLQAYAEASGDHNPIHQDEAVAKAAGLQGVIAHGMLSAAYIAERALLFVSELPGLQPGQAQLRSIQTRFKAMAFLGDVITVSGVVKDSSESALTLELQAAKQDGQIVTSGVITFSF